MRCWLMKSEPKECSFENLLDLPNQTIAWFGVRNYQARNFMRDDMQVGDDVLFYHSSCKIPGIAGLARVASTAYPDATQFDPSSPYFDPKSSPEAPRWLLVDIQAVCRTPDISLQELRRHSELSDMLVLRPGNRLSITPVTARQWAYLKQHLLLPV